MKRKISFYKEGKNWYADLPLIPKANNLMVAGADDFLDYVSKGSERVTLTVVSNTDMEDRKDLKYILIRISHDFYGANYSVSPSRVHEDCPVMTLWLCNVTHFVFGCHPKRIGIKEIINQ